MNQIINIDFDKNTDNNSNTDSINKANMKSANKKFSKKIFNVQFLLSIIAIFVILSIFIYYKLSLYKKENYSNLLINNYSIAKLYSNNSTSNDKNKLSDNSIIGVIKIPSLNLSYTIFNGLNDELLKTSPCRFYGSLPSEKINNYNLCIAGHNYDNKKFFSKIKNLNINDKIVIYDNSNNHFIYSVIKNYEVKSDDLSPVYETITNSYELTLVTCNNFNRK